MRGDCVNEVRKKSLGSKKEPILSKIVLKKVYKVLKRKEKDFCQIQSLSDTNLQGRDSPAPKP